MDEVPFRRPALRYAYGLRFFILSKTAACILTAKQAQADMIEKRKTHRKLHLTPCEHLKVPCGSLSGFKGLTCLFVDPLSWCKPIEACRTMFQATCFCLILKNECADGDQSGIYPYVHRRVRIPLSLQHLLSLHIGLLMCLPHARKRGTGLL